MRTTIATINVDHMEWNLQLVRRHAPGAKVLAMVKANAYGHGLLGTSRVLQALGVDMLGVAFVHEAEALRRGGVTAPILVITPATPEDADLIVALDLHVVVCSVAEAEFISRAATAAGATVSVHVYVDTGMHRDGVAPEASISVLDEISDFPGLSICGICTHFATADQPTSPLFQRQLALFTGVIERAAEHGYRFTYVHAANTAALWNRLSAHFTMVRPGLSIYGYALTTPADPDLRPVMTLSTTVTGVRRIAAGEGVSYGHRFVTPKETTIATLPIGYGDGYFRAYTGKSMCLLHGRSYPIVGTICMDACMVDVGDDHVEVGDTVVLLGEQADASGAVHRIDATELASLIGTIPYEVLTAISERVPRAYVGRLASIAGEQEVERV